MGKDDNSIVKTIELMCDKNNAQDKKLLLLAELVETKCDALGRTQEELKVNLKATNEKLDKLTGLLEDMKKAEEDCPVRKNKEDFDNLVMLAKHPKMSLLIVVGILSVLAGFLSKELFDAIKMLFGV